MSERKSTIRGKKLILLGPFREIFLQIFVDFLQILVDFPQILVDSHQFLLEIFENRDPLRGFFDFRDFWTL